MAFIACKTTNDAEKAKQVVTIDNLKKHVAYLSSDLCEGRKPFSKGAERAVNYLVQEMKSIGLKPINGDSYLQEVPLVLSQTQCSEVMTLSFVVAHEHITNKETIIKKHLDKKCLLISRENLFICSPHFLLIFRKSLLLRLLKN